MITLEQFNKRFKIVPTSLLGRAQDLSDRPDDAKLEGDCRTYVRTVRNILKLKRWEYAQWRAWSKPGIPRHAIMWVKGKGWIDSTTRQFRPTPAPCRRLWPIGTPVTIAIVYGTGVWYGWLPAINPVGWIMGLL